MELREEELDQLTMRFLKKNFRYLWLKAMLHKARSEGAAGRTLITGSSYGMYGIHNGAWNSAFNCSSSSQDIYYDFLCAKDVLMSTRGGHQYLRCFITDGYYVAYHDLSKGEKEREGTISIVYAHLFHDAHNWKTPWKSDLWGELPEVSEETRQICEARAMERVLSYSSFRAYYLDLWHRLGTIFDLKGRKWCEVPADERAEMGRARAESHNHLITHRATMEENKEILKEYVHFLHLNQVHPILVTSPMTPEYSRYIPKEMKESVRELIDGVSENLDYVDLNQFNCFDTSDFMDTDHLDASGAKKMSGILAKLFGK